MGELTLERKPAHVKQQELASRWNEVQTSFLEITRKRQRPKTAHPTSSQDPPPLISPPSHHVPSAPDLLKLPSLPEHPTQPPEGDRDSAVVTPSVASLAP